MLISLRNAVAAAVVTATLSVPATAMASSPAARPAHALARPRTWWYAPSSPAVLAIPGCGPGARVRKVVATYSARKQGSGGFRTDTLYCGVAGPRGYGYRHLLQHVGQYFGGWPSFSFAMAQTLKAPAAVVAQSNGNYLESAPIFQCFYQGYYIVWTFFVVPEISSGTIITAYGRMGRTVNQSCP
jgi:hypothetical protein